MSNNDIFEKWLKNFDPYGSIPPDEIKSLRKSFHSGMGIDEKSSGGKRKNHKLGLAIEYRTKLVALVALAIFILITTILMGMSGVLALQILVICPMVHIFLYSIIAVGFAFRPEFGTFADFIKETYNSPADV